MSTKPFQAPIRSKVQTIDPGWIDYNGHLNMAYYNVLFDRAMDETLEEIGIGPSYVKERNKSVFALEIHVSYLQEIGLKDPVIVETQLVEHDAKRLHFFQTLKHATEGFVSATSENMTMHVDMEVRKSAPFPPDKAERIEALAKAHSVLPRPERAGRSIGLPKASR